jgi:hypothetical protein
MIKTFTVDWDSYADVSRLGGVIKSRLGTINPKKISKKERFRVLFNACRDIWEFDTSAHYAGLDLDTERKYYVYAHLDPTSKIAINFNPRTTFGASVGMTHFPFYIGKGTGDRYKDFNWNETHRKMRQKIVTPIAIILKDNLTEAEALAFEDKLIDIFGLKVFGGYLTNLDEGYHPQQRRDLYAKPYSMMMGNSREHGRSTRPASTKPSSEDEVLMGALTVIDSLASCSSEDRG